MKPIDRKLLGPVTGNPPTLEWIAIDVLEIDPAYQRTMESPKSRKIVLGMVKGWDWRQCHPLVVTRRSDGSLKVLDGQHRLEGARQRGDIPHLPCFVTPAMELNDEAAVFVRLNTERQRLSQTEIFAAMIAAGDEAALKIGAMMRETGWVFARHGNTVEFKPGWLACGPMLARQVKRVGEAPVRNALTALREAFPDRPVRHGSTILAALIDLYAANRAPDPDALIEALGSVEGTQDWMNEAAMFQQQNPAFSRREALIEVICALAAEFAREEAA